MGIIYMIALKGKWVIFEEERKNTYMLLAITEDKSDTAQGQDT